MEFEELVGRHRGELRVHCYRLLGSVEEADDLVQETFLRAWRRRETFEGRSSERAWLYRIATNACLDSLEGRARRVLPYDLGPADPEAALPPRAEVPWLQPYPGPDDVTVARETIELAFVAAIQHLPPRQRAVLILRDVLGWPAGRCADLLEGSVAGVNSALQRARATLREHLPRGRLDWSAPPGMTPEEREVLRRYMDAMERFDLAALAELLAADVRGLMPPWPMWHRGREAMLAALATGGDQGFTMEPVLVNGGPGVAVRAGGKPFAISALRISGGRIAEIAAFHGLRNFDEFLARTPSQET